MYHVFCMHNYTVYIMCMITIIVIELYDEPGKDGSRGTKFYFQLELLSMHAPRVPSRNFLGGGELGKLTE